MSGETRENGSKTAELGRIRRFLPALLAGLVLLPVALSMPARL